MQVELFKKVGQYTDKKSGEVKNTVNFYVMCGDNLIAIEPVYYSKKDEKGEDLRDFGFNARKEVLKSFATILPEKQPQ